MVKRKMKAEELTAPYSRPEYNGFPQLERLLTAYEKQLLTEGQIEHISDQAFASALAVTANVLIWNFHELLNPETRLKVFHQKCKEAMIKLDKPDEPQQFAEWYWESTVGDELLRMSEKEVKKMAKKYQVELSKVLQQYIDTKGLKAKDIMSGCNIARCTYYNIVGGGPYSRKNFDAVAKYVGFVMDEKTKLMYDARFEIGTTDKEERMEDIALVYEGKTITPIEDTPEEVTEASSPVSDEIKPIPVPDDLGKLVEEVIVHSDDGEAVETTKDVIYEEDLPFTDCNDMYKECEKEEKKVSAVDLLKEDMEKIEKEGEDIAAVIYELQEKIAQLKDQKERLFLKYNTYAECIQKLEELQ